MPIRRPHYGEQKDAFIEEVNRGIEADPASWGRSSQVLLKCAQIIEETVKPHVDVYRAYTEDRLEGVPPPSRESEEHAAFETAANEMLLLLVASMLQCMSLECRLKARITRIGHSLPKGADGHDLAKLASSAGLQLTSDEVTRLRELTLMGQFGRYPVYSRRSVWTAYELGVDHTIIKRIEELLSPGEEG